MKKTAILTLCMVIALIGRSQVLNSGFENLNPNGTIKNWGDIFLWAVSLDSNGVATPDSVIFDYKLYFSTNDAHTGAKALEMRNAFNYTSNQKIAGSARVSKNDTDYAAFVEMIDAQQRPSHFNFYYKFYPAGMDTAQGYMSVFDSLGNEIGSAELNITVATSIYQLASQPILYTSQDPAAFITMGFRTAKPGTAANFGTRFLVDDINLLITALDEKNFENSKLVCFPNPSGEFIDISLDAALHAREGKIEIADANGKIVGKRNFSGGEKLIRFQTSDLPNGVYAIHFYTKEKSYCSTFIK